MPQYKSHTITTTTKYVEFIRKNCKPDDVLFRGQPLDKPLLPKIARVDLKYPIRQAERRMMQEFKRRALPLLDIQPRSTWDWLVIAQHHGMATRLLDWTLNPLAALWFAVNQPALKKKGKALPGVVWVLVPRRGDYAVASTDNSPFTIDRTKIFRPKHIARRLVTQAGWFTVHDLMSKENRFGPLETNKAYSARLTKLSIPPDSFAGMRSELDRFNVNASTLFPDIDGLCSHLQWANSLLNDEKGDQRNKGTEQELARKSGSRRKRAKGGNAKRKAKREDK